MKIVITGANGQLGKSLRALSDKEPHSFIFTDIEELDITDENAISAFMHMHRPEVIINCAAYTNTDAAESNHELAQKLNGDAPTYLAKAAKNIGATLIHISTDYVFNGLANIPYKENDTPQPVSVYGSTKLAGERGVINSGCKYIILRTAWLYSPFGKNFMLTMLKLTAEKEHLKVVFDQVGTPTSALTLADAIMYIIDSKQLDKVGLYHFSNEGVCSWYDFALAIRDITRHKAAIEPCHSDEFPAALKRPAYSVLDKIKFKNSFSYSIPHWYNSLDECLKML